MPKTTQEISLAYVQENNPIDTSKRKWYSEEEVKNIKAKAYELGVNDGYLERINEVEKEQLKEEGLL